jgi:hypothetical protein
MKPEIKRMVDRLHELKPREFHHLASRLTRQDVEEIYAIDRIEPRADGAIHLCDLNGGWLERDRLCKLAKKLQDIRSKHRAKWLAEQKAKREAERRAGSEESLTMDQESRSGSNTASSSELKNKTVPTPSKGKTSAKFTKESFTDWKVVEPDKSGNLFSISIGKLPTKPK